MHSSIRIGLLTLLCALPLSSRPASAQQPPPPIQGVTGTIATEGTIDAEHKAAHTIAEGAAYVVDSVKKILPGGKGTKQNPLDDFAEGSRVILRDVAKVDGESPATTEGVVVDVNHRKNQITIRLADKKTETLRVATPDATADVVVSYTDNTGAKIAARLQTGVLTPVTWSLSRRPGAPRRSRAMGSWSSNLSHGDRVAELLGIEAVDAGRRPSRPAGT